MVCPNHLTQEVRPRCNRWIKSLIPSYRNNPKAYTGAFRDGWFDPGDEAVMPLVHQRQLMGRRDDLLSWGGAQSLSSFSDKRYKT